MLHLYQLLQQHVTAWREAGYPSDGYSPDFVVRRRDGRCYIVEIKDARFHDDAVDGAQGRKAIAVQGWVGLNPDKLQYEMIFTGSDSVAFNQLKPVKAFVEP